MHAELDSKTNGNQKYAHFLKKLTIFIALFVIEIVYISFKS